MTPPLHVRIDKGADASRVLLLVHGLGADEHDLATAVPYLDPAGQFVAVLPRAPHAYGPGYAWFPFGPGGRDTATFDATVDLLDDALDAACAQLGMPRAEAIVAGFSQGAAMVTALGYRANSTRPRPAGVLAMSGFLGGSDSIALATGDDLPPALVQHGTHDPMVPSHRGRRLAEMLEAHGAGVVFREYPMQHQLSLESLADARDWIAAVVRGERPSMEGAS